MDFGLDQQPVSQLLSPVPAEHRGVRRSMIVEVGGQAACTS